jgi:hypothetical protein
MIFFYVFNQIRDKQIRSYWSHLSSCSPFLFDRSFYDVISLKAEHSCSRRNNIKPAACWELAKLLFIITNSLAVKPRVRNVFKRIRFILKSLFLYSHKTVIPPLLKANFNGNPRAMHIGLPIKVSDCQNSAFFPAKTHHSPKLFVF